MECCIPVACRSWNSLLDTWESSFLGRLGSLGSVASCSAAAIDLSLRAPVTSTLCRSYLQIRACIE